VSVDQLASLVAEVAGKRIRFEHVDGPVGVQARNFVCERIEAIGWASRVSLREGLSRTYPWVASQVEAVGARR
jgi:nucleoside-diphosphate-sugar epimerase